MGLVPQQDALPNIPVPNAARIVAPFAADIDTTYTGSVRFSSFVTIAQLNRINSFIHSQTDDEDFSGSILFVAEWNQVPKHTPFSVGSLSGHLVQIL